MIKKKRLIIKMRHSRGQGHRFFGYTLSAVGFFWLAKKVDWIPAFDGGLTIFWPMVVLLFGIFIASRIPTIGK